MDNVGSSGRAPPEDRIDKLIRALFHGAVRDGHYNTVLALLGEGADPRNGYAVMQAASHGHLEILRLLSGAGANLRVFNDQALGEDAYNGHTEVVRELLAAGCDPAIHNHGPLRVAEAHGHVETARLLREAGSLNPETPGDSPAKKMRAVILARLRLEP